MPFIIQLVLLTGVLCASMMIVYAVDETNATVTESDEEVAEPLPRAARYTRNEMPLLIIRPVSGPIPMSSSNHHIQGPQTRNGAGFYINGPRDGGEFPVKQFMSHFGEIISSVSKNVGPYPTMQNVQVIHASSQQPPHGPNFIYSEAPSVRQHQQPTKFFYRSQPPHENRFHPSMAAGPKTHGHKSVNNFDKSHFRASQPLPLVDNTDLPASSIFQSKRYQNQNNDQPNRSSVKLSKPNYRAVTASTFLETDNSEEWSPFAQSLAYPKNFLNSENRQYQQQERISFYPDTNPEYFQPHHNYDTPVTEAHTTTVVTPPNRQPYNFISTSESKYQSYVAPPSFRSPTTESPTSLSTKLNEDLPLSHKRVPYIRRKYRTKKPLSPKQQQPDYSDDVKPVVEYPNESSSSDTKQIYLRNAITPRSTETYVPSTIRNENESAAIFITPVTPTYTDAVVLDDNSTPETVTPATETSITSKRKHSRIFRRKLVQNISASGIMGESCESSCLSNIVSRDYDPVCGSDDKSYANLGRLRCTKICGDHHLRIQHFGSCERTTNTVTA